jgi:predicted  nucleic acid-binding Zn-ribbon protein
VHPSLEQLRQLQDLERQAAALRADLEAVDQRRREIEAPVLEAQATLDGLTRTIDERQAERRAGDRDVAALQQRLAKFRQQLMAVTNNREYEAVQHEIATAEAQLKAREDETIALLFELDELTPQAVDTQREVNDRRDAAPQARTRRPRRQHRRPANDDRRTGAGDLRPHVEAVSAPCRRRTEGRTLRRLQRQVAADGRLGDPQG